MRKNKFLILTFLLIFGLATLIGQAVAQEKNPTTSSPKQDTAAKPSAPKVNNITQAAVKAGALSCASRVNQVTNFLTSSSPDFGALMFMTPDNPDRQMFSVSMEIPLKDFSAYASADFAPNQANGCGSIYETVVYWPKKCAEVAEQNFSTFKKSGSLSKNITVLNGGESSKAFLLPAGTGCVSIKKEIVR